MKVKELGKRARERLYDRTVGKVVLKMSLEQQVALSRGIMPLSATTIPNCRKTLLNNLPNDFRVMLRGGKTKEQIKEYYWSCKAFVEYWSDLEMAEATFDELLRGTE